MYEHFRNMPCSILLLIDACHSGNAIDSRELRNFGELAIGPEIIVSCQADQLSYFDDQLRYVNGQWVGHGAFTTTLIEALTGSQVTINGNGERSMKPLPLAAVDENNDGDISIGEVSAYTKRRLPELVRLIRPNQTDEQAPEFLPSATFAASAVTLRLAR